jgi:hypothetical protein
MKTMKKFIGPLLLVSMGQLVSGAAIASARYVYENEGISYPYVTEVTGENYTFEFERNPGKEGGRLKASLHVLSSVYGDDSIDREYSEVFMKEGAKCYVFEARFYSYRTCFLPNDYSPDKKDRFWGFVSRLPNAMWFLTRNGIPAALVLGGVVWAFRRR